VVARINSPVCGLGSRVLHRGGGLRRARSSWPTGASWDIDGQLKLACAG